MLEPRIVRHLLIVIIALIAAGSTDLMAQSQIHWTGEGSDDSWTNPLNWSTYQVPGADDSVLIDLSSFPVYSVIVDGEQAVKNLQVATSTATVHVNGTLTIENLTLSSGRLDGPGTIEVNGEMMWTGGSVYGDGRLVLNGPAVSQSTFSRGNALQSRTMEVRDRLLIDAWYIEPSNNATIIIEEDAVLELGENTSGLNPRSIVNPSRLINRGLIVKPSGEYSRGVLGGTFSGRLIVENYGEIRADAGYITVYVHADAVIDGTFVSNGQAIEFYNDDGLQGESRPVGGVLRGSGGFLFLDALHLVGEIDLDGPMMMADGQTFAEELTITRIGHLDVRANPYNERVFVFATLDAPTIPSLGINGRFVLESDLAVEQHVAVGYNQAAELTANATLTILPDGALEWGLGRAEGSGMIHVQGMMRSSPVSMPDGDFIRQASGTELSEIDVILDGETVWDDGDLTLGNGATVTIGEAGVFRLERDAQITGSEESTGQERIINHGTFAKTGIGKRISQGDEEFLYDDVSSGTVIDVDFENAGTLSARVGEIIISGQFIQMGLIEGTSTLDFSDGGLQLLDGRVAPGPDIGALTLVGDIELYDQVLEIDLASSGHDQLIVDGNLALGGNLYVSATDYVAGNEDEFVIATASGSVSGSFDEVYFDDFGGLQPEVEIIGSDVVLRFLGASEPILTVDVEAIQFEEVAPGQPAEASFMISNSGDALLTIESAHLLPEDAPFDLEGLYGDIEPGESHSVRVIFVTDTPGSYEAMLSISSNGGTAEIALWATAIEEDEARPILNVDVETIQFDEVAPGEPAEASFTISNSGDALLTIESAHLLPEDAPFDLEGLYGDIEPGESHSVRVIFVTDTPGSYEAMLSISSNGGTAEIALWATAIEEDEARPILNVDVETIQFDEVAPGEPAEASFTISNSGDALLTIESAHLLPEDAPFDLEGLYGDIEPSESRSVRVIFVTDTPGSYEAMLTILSNGGTAEISLHAIVTGTVAEPPTAVDDQANTTAGRPVVIHVLANDYDPAGSVLQIVSVTDPRNGEAVIEGEAIVYTPASGFVGTDSFRYVVSNEEGLTAEASVTVNVMAFGYTITDLSPSTSIPAKATSISPEGIVSGVTLTDRGTMPFLWAGGVAKVIDVRDNATVTPYSVNDRGEMVGVAVYGDSTSRAVVISPDGTLNNLGSLGGDVAIAYDRNRENVVVGMSSDDRKRYQAFTWKDGEMTHIPISAEHSEAFSVNDRGEVAGALVIGEDVQRAFAGDWVAEAPNTRAYSINNAGLAVGSALQDNRIVGMIWNRDGESAVLESDGAAFAEAYAVNDAGWVVGTSGHLAETASKGPAAAMGPSWMGPGASFARGLQFESAQKTTTIESLRATLWVDGESYDLNELVHGSAGWTLYEARHINASGEVVGFGIQDGRTAAFLLTPVDGETIMPRMISRDVYGAAPLTVHASELTESNSGELKLLSADEPRFGDVTIADDGSHLSYFPLSGIAARDSFQVYIGNGKGASVSTQIVVNLRAEETAEASMRLQPNYPNPFSYDTNVRFTLAETDLVRITLYDMLGREVKVLVDEERPAGVHDIPLYARDLASGTYILQMTISTASESRIVNVIR